MRVQQENKESSQKRGHSQCHGEVQGLGWVQKRLGRGVATCRDCKMPDGLLKELGLASRFILLGAMLCLGRTR